MSTVTADYVDNVELQRRYTSKDMSIPPRGDTRREYGEHWPKRQSQLLHAVRERGVGRRVDRRHTAMEDETVHQIQGVYAHNSYFSTLLESGMGRKEIMLAIGHFGKAVVKSADQIARDYALRGGELSDVPYILEAISIFGESVTIVNDISF